MARTKKYEAIGKTDSEGKLRLYNRDLLDQFFKSVPDRTIELQIRALGDKHSDSLRAYYFAEPVAKIQKGLRALGNDLDRQECHEFCKTLSSVTSREIIIEDPVTGKFETKSRVVSISKLNNSDMLQYIEDLKRFAAEFLHIIVNDPNEMS